MLGHNLQYGFAIAPPHWRKRIAFPFIHHVRPRMRAGHIAQREKSFIQIFPVLTADVRIGVLQMNCIPREIRACVLHIVKQNIAYVAPIFAVVMHVRALPGDL